MISPDGIDSTAYNGLATLIDSDRRDVLSVLVDLDPGKVKQGATGRAAAAWVRRTLRERLHELPEAERAAASQYSHRVLDRLSDGRLRARGVALYAGPDLWHEFWLPVPLPNCVTYGAPEIVPLLSALDEYKPYGVLLVSRETARLLISYLGRSSITEEHHLSLNVREWPYTAGGSPAMAGRTGTEATRGAQGETFEQRVDDHLHRFWDQAAGAAAAALRERGINRIIVGGPDEAAHAVRALWPDQAVRVIGVAAVRSSASAAEIQQSTSPLAAEDQRTRERDLVNRIMGHAGGSMGSALGRDATLRVLMERLAMVVAATPDVDGEVWRCTPCRFVSAQQVSICPLCGAALETIRLQHILPLLVRRNGAQLELVGGEAADRLGEHGGIGAVFRYVTGA